MISTLLLLAISPSPAGPQAIGDSMPILSRPRPARHDAIVELGPGPSIAASERLLAFYGPEGPSVYETATRTVTSLGLELVASLDERATDARGGTVVFSVKESQNGLDLDGDGDMSGIVPLAFRLGEGLVSAPLDLAEFIAPLPLQPPTLQLVSERDVAVSLSERALGLGDVHGDGSDLDLVVLHWDLEANAVRFLGYLVGRPVVGGGRIAFRVPEELVGDLNGDGDALDQVLHCFDPVEGDIQNTQLAIEGLETDIFEGGDGVRLGERWDALRVSESGQGVDLNGDGDLQDAVLHVFDRNDGTLTSLGWASALNDFDDGSFGTYFHELVLVGDHLAFLVEESEQGGNDLNGDGDALDRLLFAYHLPTGTTRNVEVDAQRFAISEDILGWTVPEGVFDYARPATMRLPDGPLQLVTALGLPGTPLLPMGSSFVFEAYEGISSVDWNADGDLNDTSALIVEGESGDFVATSHGIRRGTTRLMGSSISFGASEVSDGVDWTGDGDLQDTVLGILSPVVGDRILPHVRFEPFGELPYLDTLGPRELAVWQIEGTFPALEALLFVVRFGH